MGYGPLTGRGAGNCGGQDAPGYSDPRGWRGFFSGWGGGRRRGWGGGFGRGAGWGRGFGGGRGLGRGRGAGWGAGPPDYPPEAEDEAGFLRAESKRLRAQMKAIEKRLGELEKTE
jgi:hypothetical protein